MLSTIGSIASQSGITRYQDIVVPTTSYRMKTEDGHNMFSSIIQSPLIDSTETCILYTNIYVEKGIFYAGRSSRNAYIAMLEPDLEGGSALTHAYFAWYLECTDGTNFTIASAEQDSYERHQTGRSLKVNGWIYPISVGNKIPYRFRMDYSGNGWDASWGNYSLSQSVYFLFVRK